MEIENKQNASSLPGGHAGTTSPNARPTNTAMWLSSMDPVSSQIMESLITTNFGQQALASSFNLFNFIFQNFENFANELNENPIDENFRIKFERPTEPKERPNPNNTFEMIRTMRGHISVGMWALILYCKEGFLSVHLLPSDFIASIIDDKMSDFPAYLEITQQEGLPGNWQIENKPIVIEVIPGLIRHLVEHLVRVSRGEAPANERFSFFTPRKTKETTGVFAMPASVQAAIAGNVLSETASSNGGAEAPQALAPAPAQLSQQAFQPQYISQPQTQTQNSSTRSQYIMSKMQEARAQADGTANQNQIFYNEPNQATIAQERTVAVQQFSLPGAPELNFKNPSSSGTNINAASPPAFLAPPVGLFGGGPGAPQSPAQGMISPPPSLLSNSGTDANTVVTPPAFNTAPQSPFARPVPPPELSPGTPPVPGVSAPQNPGTSATSLAALLNASTSAASQVSNQNPNPVPPPPAPLSQSGVMQAPPPPPGLPPRPLPPPGVPTGFGAPPSPPFNAPPPPPAPGSNTAMGAPPPLPFQAPPPPMPPIAANSTPPNTTPGAQNAGAPVPVVPFPNFTQTSMPAASVPESVILGEAASPGQSTTPLSLFDDDEELFEADSYDPSEEELISDQSFENPEPSILSQSNESIDLFESNESNETGESQDPSESPETAEIFDSGDAAQEIVEYEQEESEYQSYENSEEASEQESGENSDEVNYEQVEGGFEDQESYDGNYQDYANEGSVEAGGYEQYETDQSYPISPEVNGFAASIEDPLDSPEALVQIMEQSQRVVRDGCFHILGELDQVLDSLRAAAQVAMHNDNIQAVTDIMQHSKQIKALRERLVSFKEENIKDDE